MLKGWPWTMVTVTVGGFGNVLVLEAGRVEDEPTGELGTLIGGGTTDVGGELLVLTGGGGGSVGHKLAVQE